MVNVNIDGLKIVKLMTIRNKSKWTMSASDKLETVTNGIKTRH